MNDLGERSVTHSTGAPAAGPSRSGAKTAVAWHALSPRAAVERLESTSDGLTEPEARARLAKVGPNALRPVSPASAWHILLDQLRSVIVLLLVVAVVLAVLSRDPVDAAAIGVVLAVNVALGFSTELRARRAMEALLTLDVARAVVVRAGRAREMDARELVPGDVVEVEAGQAVPADARLLHTSDLRVSEAPLTGESVPVAKRADPSLPEDAPLAERETMLYKGTVVVAGSGRAVVVATGMDTEVGRIGTLVQGIADEPTPLERRLDGLGRRLAAVAVGVAVVIAGLNAVQGATLGAVLQTAIAVAVAAVPEGLPAVITITMAVGVRRMARRRALVRRLPTVESLGAATVICTDKTGTLTSGEMTVTTLWVDGREIRITGAGYAPAGEFLQGERRIDPRLDPAVALAARIAVLANRADLGQGTAAPVPRGDPTEVALLVAGRKAGLERNALQPLWPEEGDLPFSSERMWMATFHREGGAGPVVANVKGAPRRVLAMCDQRLSGQGAEPLDEAVRGQLLAANEGLATRGLRVLALATGPVQGTTEDALRGLTFVGFVGLTDPPAPGVRATIQTLRDAGIRTVMLTGDQRRTAEAIARELGLVASGEETLDGGDIDRLSDDELAGRVERLGVISRVSPEAKLRIVTAYQRRGEVVAMLGDGVNDAAALKKADVGVAMGMRGTDVAKEVAGVVLQDDRFATIAAAVEEGRVIFANIRKFVFYLFSCNLAEILVLLGAGLAGLPLPLLPLQILWLNLLTDTFPALALAFEPAEPGLMRRPPRDPRTAILSGGLLRATAVHAGVIAGSTLAAFAWGRAAYPTEPARATTLSFMTLALAQVLHLVNARSETPLPLRDLILGNRFAVGAVVLTTALQVAAVQAEPLANVLGTRALSAGQALVVIALALIPAVAGQLLLRVRSSLTSHP